MKFYINRLRINGSKSIEEPIEFMFSNKTIDNFDFERSNVKAIYGPNGAGKSGIITAIYIYKHMISGIDGLTDNYFSKFVYETINVKTKRMIIDIVFTIEDFETNKKYSTYRHMLVLEKRNDSVVILEENIYFLKGRSIIDENFAKIISINNGSITFINDVKDNKINEEPLYLISLNLLDKFSIANCVLNGLRKNNPAIDISLSRFDSILSILLFANNLVVEINKDDIHYEYITNEVLKKLLDSEEKITKKTIELKNNLSPSNYMFMISTHNKDVISKEYFDKYEENIKKLTNFLKIYKPSLDEIIIDKKINDDKYYCEKIMKYGPMLIDMEFESTGIKKLIKLYTALNACANGHVTFIDEMDANLHDVYFTKMIEFFKNDSRGQLCFTTHNLEPIDVLKTGNHSLDFISDNSKVYSWIKNGNRSPLKLYKEGFIPYSPFNIESFNFDILLDEEK